MSRRKPGQQPEKEIHHPDDPSIYVIVRKPESKSSDAVTAVLMKWRTIRIVYGKNDVPAIDEKTKEPMKYIDQIWPQEVNIVSLRQMLVKVCGAEMPDGSPVTDAAELYEEWLDVSGPFATKTDGNTNYAFGRYIVSEINKPDFWSPLPSASDAPST